MEDAPIDSGQDIDSFIEYISQVNNYCYFHNLKFDGGFILYWLLTHDYTHIETKGGGAPGTFKSLISDMGQVYSITVYWENGKTTEFRDSFKKLPMTVRRIAKAFALEEGKGDLDYELDRPLGWVPTEEEMDYLRRDVKIVAHAMRQVLNSGMDRLTVASDSLAEYKRLVTPKGFDRMFPTLSYEMDMEIRRAYRGGWTYADSRYSGKINPGGIVLDVNSLYPSVMRYKPIPYGTPEFKRGKVETSKEFPLSIFAVTFIAKLKENHVPCIQIKGSSIFQPTMYQTEINEPTTLMVTNVDWELYNDHYDIDVLEWGGGWLFHAIEGMYDVYVDKWAGVKEVSKGGAREIAKLHLNSLYGKFASNPNVVSKIPKLEDGVVRYDRGVDEIRNPVYTAAGVFITSYARDITIRAAQANYDTFAYADTDSLHLLVDNWEEFARLNTPETQDQLCELAREQLGIDIHPSRMGAWKFEYSFDSSYYIRPKAYLEHMPGKAPECDEPGCELRHDYVTRIAGLPEAVSGTLTFDDLIEGNVLHGKLHPVSVPGGIILENIPFELKLR